MKYGIHLQNSFLVKNQKKRHFKYLTNYKCHWKSFENCSKSATATNSCHIGFRTVLKLPIVATLDFEMIMTCLELASLLAHF